MTRLNFFLHTALEHLRHGGQRIGVAVLCVAFGVMSLVAMTLLSSSLERMLVETPHDLIGADISMDRSAEDAILPEHIEGLDELVKDGVLGKYTLVAYTSSLTFHLPDSGELRFPNEGIGIDPAAYPPIGALSVEGSESAGLPTLLAEVGDVLVSRDLALEYHLALGDSLVLADLNAGKPLPARIRGIITDTPNHKGSKLYYSLETAAQLEGSDRSLNTVLATTADSEAAESSLKALGWRVFMANDLAEADEFVQDLFATLLNGAGVLGLLVSGVGIANTMQVLLRRRQREVAVWKSLGYRSSDLMVLFALEAGILGLVGSLLGAGLGVAVSYGLVDLFSRTSTMLIRWVLAPEPVLLAVLVGVTTTVVFALWAIVSTSRVSPVTLLRGQSASAAQLPRFQSGLLFVLLAVPFTAVISLIMGSFLKAVGVLAGALVGLAVLGGLLGGLLWLVTRLLPLHGLPLLNMARGNLARRGLAPVFALVALFVGVTALTLASVVTQSAYRVIDSVTLETQGPNLTILAPAEQAKQVTAALDKQGIEDESVNYSTRVRAIHLATDSQQVLSPVLTARTDLSGYTFTGADWGSKPDGVYTPEMDKIPEGSLLKVELWDGTIRDLPVVGSYRVDTEQVLAPEQGILLPVELSQSIAPADQAQYWAHIPAARLAAAAGELGGLLPNATVINLVAYSARFTAMYHNLFLFAISMAGLAILAGMLLMANSVSLSVLDRRFEIGVLKAMGYTRGHVLLTLMVEYALVGLLAAGAGLAVVKGFLWLAGLRNEVLASLMVLTPEVAGGILLFTLCITLFTVLAVAWKSTQVSPLVVLNDRE
ncbi:predicted ABC-type transport system [Longilinea arvoryzae]|uniref:Predicted ABC-type transport system n=1 Tax=Longilinea arvoryzae TaxID=360412 RepID=A0A0S7BDV1_9CHLR|nr:FtsX-like permease family protein [Longilinea arvoryzae]GAP12659.1 predicted ABC-type transport system [Longilinea arvoryzae]